MVLKQEAVLANVVMLVRLEEIEFILKLPLTSSLLSSVFQTLAWALDAIFTEIGRSQMHRDIRFDRVTAEQ
jgi:hypothetical protein